jgi:hypothetical protein
LGIAGNSVPTQSKHLVNAEGSMYKNTFTEKFKVKDKIIPTQLKLIHNSPDMVAHIHNPSTPAEAGVS